MADGNKAKRLSKVAKEFNVGISTIVDFLHKNGVELSTNPNNKVEPDVYDMLEGEFSRDIKLKKESEKIELKNKKKKETISIADEYSEPRKNTNKDDDADDYVETEVDKLEVKVVGKIDLNRKPEPKKEVEKETPKPEPVVEKEQPKPVVKPEVPIAKESYKANINESDEIKTEVEQLENPKVVGRIDLSALNQKTRPSRKSKEERDAERREKRDKQRPQQQQQQQHHHQGRNDAKGGKPQHGRRDDNFVKQSYDKPKGPTVVGKIDLPEERQRSGGGDFDPKKKRKRISKERVDVSNVQDRGGRPPHSHSPSQQQQGNKGKKGGKPQKRPAKVEVDDEDVQKQIKDTLARLTANKGKSKGSKYRREKRDAASQRTQEEIEKLEAEKNILKVTEFVSVNELAMMMGVAATQVIGTCMSLGLFVSINQRLDAETMALVADEFGFKVEFVSADVLEAIGEEEEDNEADLLPRAPIVTVMGHVDHGKTSLLDYIRRANVIAGEAGGITQHIGAYSVNLESGQKITFLDTPGHEAFTAMRARGAQVTDIAIIIVAADDSIMPQTIEAINHAQAAGVPIIFAINKIDKPTANPEKIKEALANMNFLVEEWGGKYQSQDISAKAGINIDALLEKVLLEAEMLELKANPNKKAIGTVIEASLDKGRGFVTNLLVQAGTLKVGDILLAGNHTGRVRAMYNERNEQVQEAGPSQPVLVLGMNGASQAGDKFNIMDTDREAKEIANRRQQLAREQGLRTQKHITLDEIGRRIAIGNFQELNVIVKGDVDGSVEALSDSLIKLSTEEIQVNVKHKAVGQISESDILLAAASDAIVIGFQVRPSMSARKLAEKEEIDVRLYSVIYDAINEVRDAMEGMLSPEIREEITATVEILELFKITKVGTIAGCMVREGKIKRTSKIRIIRDGIVVYTGALGSLRRFKDEAKEVVAGLECGLNIDNFNDIKVGDLVEAYEETEIKRTL